MMYICIDYTWKVLAATVYILAMWRRCGFGNYWCSTIFVIWCRDMQIMIFGGMILGDRDYFRDCLYHSLWVGFVFPQYPRRQSTVVPIRVPKAQTKAHPIIATNFCWGLATQMGKHKVQIGFTLYIRCFIISLINQLLETKLSKYSCFQLND